MNQRRVVIAVGSMVGLLALAGVGALVLTQDDGGGDALAGTTPTAPARVTATTSPSPKPTVPTPTTATPTTTPAAMPRALPGVQVDEMRNGNDVGLIKRVADVGGGRVVLVFDRVEYLEGSAGEKAAEAAGEEFVNDYFIRNDNPLQRQVPLAVDVKVLGSILLNQGHVPADADPVPPRVRSLADLRAFLAARPAGQVGPTFRWTVKDGEVVNLMEVYAP